MITKKIISKIRKSKTCKAALQLVLNKQAPTIQRYLDTNDIMLTTHAALRVISMQLKVPQSEILEPIKTTI